MLNCLLQNPREDIAMNAPPKVDNAPGLVWKPMKDGWAARWYARADLVRRGYKPKSISVWSGQTPDKMEIGYIQQRCGDQQTDMLAFSAGGVPKPGKFDGTIDGLIACYRSDKVSPYRKLRYNTRIYYDTLCRSITRTEWETEEGVTLAVGETPLSDIKARVLLTWYAQWSDGGHLAMAHGMIGMLRTMFGFGLTMLEDEQCERLSVVLHKMKFPAAKPRNERLTAEQAAAVCSMAHDMGFHSIALAQAFQFDLMLRQKDVIGEWIPISEQPISTLVSGNDKWLRGIQWQEVDQNLILRHTTSKRQKEIEVNLRLAPMVMMELGHLYGSPITRDKLPKDGPIILQERVNIPWTADEFRRRWRQIATACGIPKEVRNMDSRAGAITEATEAGADLEHIKHAATHSDISMTQRYSRAGTEKTAGVMELRAAHRQNKTGK